MALHESRFAPAGFKRASFDAIVPEGTDVSALLASEFWAHNARKLSPFAEITAVEETGAWYARLLVLDSGKNWASVRLLEKVTLDPVEAAPSADFRVEFKGPIHKHRVVRVSDGAEMVKGLSKADAFAWVETHMKAVAA